MIYRILYCSCNRLSGTAYEIEAEIYSILQSSRSHNEKGQITGALLFNERVFAQVLEGPRSEVECIYDRICSDPRHDEIVLLEADYIVSRDFENWTMAFSEPESELSFYTDLNFDRAKADPLGTAEEILKVLKMMVFART